MTTGRCDFQFPLEDIQQSSQLMRRIKELTRLGEKEVTDHAVAVKFSVSDRDI
jgi:hypothetical protein